MAKAREVHRILNHFQERLYNQIVRSTLLDAGPGELGRGQKLDVRHLERYAPGLPDKLVDCVLAGRRPCHLRPQWRRDDDLFADDDIEQDRMKLFRQMDRHLIRGADKLRRETGNRSLWLGYPLIFVEDPQDQNRPILAPIFLWPITAVADTGNELGVTVQREAGSEGPEFNQVMAAWIQRKRGVTITPPTTVPKERAELTEIVKKMFAPLDIVRVEQLQEDLQPAPPRKREIPTGKGSRVFNAAVMGIMRWQNQAIIDDLAHLTGLDSFERPFSNFIAGSPMQTDGGVAYDNEADRHHVTPADFSQEKAILRARETPGVAVHGPPGTGKSQTITNIVADALAREERVLVVCQKRAAIDVVAQRLKKAGFESLYAIVHDTVGDRRTIIDLIKDQLKDLRSGENRNGNIRGQVARLCSQIENYEQELDDVFRAYYRDHIGCQLTFREIMDKLLKVESAHPDVRPDRDIGAMYRGQTDTALKSDLELVDEMGKRFASCRPDENPWRMRRPDFDLTPTARRDFDEATTRILEADSQHEAYCQEHGCGMELPEDLDRFREAEAEIHSALDDLTAEDDLQHVLDRHAAGVRARGEKFNLGVLPKLMDAVKNADLDPQLDRIVPHHEPTEAEQLHELASATLHHRKRWRPMWWAGLNAQFRALRRRLRPLLLESALQWSWQDIARFRDLLYARFVRRHLRETVCSLPGVQLDENAAEQDVIAMALRVFEQDQKVDRLLGLETALAQLESLKKAIQHADLNAVLRWQKSLAQAIARCNLVSECDQTIDRLDGTLQANVLGHMKSRTRKGDSNRADIELLTAHLASLQSLISYETKLTALGEREQNLIEHLIKDHDEIDECTKTDLGDYWRVVVEHSALDAWRQASLQHFPRMRDMHDTEVSDLREKLRETIGHKAELEPKAIRSYWREKGTEHVHRPWQLILRKTGPNAKRLREIVHLGNDLGLFDLRPCWLASPEVVSQIIPLIPGIFDLVIFDEASQLPLEQAAPAVFRGERVVVAGDEHQLPPTSFFQAGTEPSDNDNGDGQNDEDDADALGGPDAVAKAGRDLAIGSTNLLDFSTKILPEEVLNVHYRSRHPALIEFSNWAFYKGELQAAHPSWGSLTDVAAPICIHRVDGVYSSGRGKQINRLEAAHVVKLLDHLWSQPGTVPTIGVVTFNRHQEEAIESGIAQLVHTNHRFKALWERELNRKDGEQDVGFFVKNLESVQGDERDLIIFSTTFGPTEPGNAESFRRFFGPLTQAGGERRLNVAVTRSKDGIILVTSMPFDRISDCVDGILPGRTIKARDFLQVYTMYADAVAAASDAGQSMWLNQAAALNARTRNGRARSQTPEFDSVLEEQVYNNLVSRGWTVETQIGEAGFRIDLAVLHPEPTKGYLLGIECDGATYHSGRTARTRDVWREDILRGYGWDIYRVWSTRWWTDSDAVTDEVCDRLKELLRARGDMATGRGYVLPRVEDVAGDAAPSAHIEETAASEPSRFPTHVPTAEDIGDIPPSTDGEGDAGSGTTSGEKRQEVFADLGQLLDALHGDQFELEVRQWENGALVWRLMLVRRRMARLLEMRSNSDVYTQVDIGSADADVLQQASLTLARCQSYRDAQDWIRELQIKLYPDIWG